MVLQLGDKMVEIPRESREIAEELRDMSGEQLYDFLLFLAASPRWGREVTIKNLNRFREQTFAALNVQ